MFLTEVAEIEVEIPSQSRSRYQVVVVGGGPAGISLGAGLHEAEFSDWLLIQPEGGLLPDYPEVYWHSNSEELSLEYKTFSTIRLEDPITTSNFRSYLSECLQALPMQNRLSDEVRSLRESVDGRGHCLEVVHSDQIIEAKVVVLATGVRANPVLPTIRGPIPPTYFTWNLEWERQRIAVFGSGASAWDAVYYLSSKNHVIWFREAEKFQKPFFRLRSFFGDLQLENRCRVLALPYGDCEFTEEHLLVLNGTIPVGKVDKVVVCCGNRPEWPRILRREEENRPSFGVSDDSSTDIPGLFVIGSLARSSSLEDTNQFVDRGKPDQRKKDVSKILEYLNCN